MAHGGVLLLRDWLLNTGVLLSLVVGIGGVLSGEHPWRWLGPVIGALGIVVSFAGHRERSTPSGAQRTAVLPTWVIWAAAIGIPLLCLATMWAMWT